MSEAVVVDIPSLIRRYQLPEHYYPSYLRHPNQPFSSPSSVSSSSSSISSFDQECDANDAVNESLSAISVDGEVDTRVDIIQHQQHQPVIVVVEKMIELKHFSRMEKKIINKVKPRRNYILLNIIKGKVVEHSIVKQ